VATEYGELFLLCAEANFILWALAARRDWARVYSAWFALRRWLNGAAADGTTPGFLASAAEPILPSVALWYALRGWLWPLHTTRLIAGIVSAVIARVHYGTERHAAVRVTMPSILTTHNFWFFVSVAAAIALYIALRRVGAGQALRGFAVSVCSLLMIGGTALVIRELLLQLHERLLGQRIESALVALIAFAVVWFCHDRRDDMIAWSERSLFG
jgi:hypothetical protein